MATTSNLRNPPADVTPADTSFFGHPRGLATLFFTEMWERFSYYGMRALLILFMTHKLAEGGLGFDKAKAGDIYGMYTAMVYLLCLGGGWVADRITGQRRAVLIGGILIAAGEFCLATPGEAWFYLGLVFLMMGTGMLKGNVSTIVGQLYAKKDPRRDSGFSLFYMGINTGALLSSIVCPLIGEKVSFRLGFAVAGLAMLAGLVQYVLGGRHLGMAGLHTVSSGDVELDRRRKQTATRALSTGLGAFALFGLLGATGIIPVTAAALSAVLGWVLLGISVAVFSWMTFSGSWSPEERKRSAAILVLFIASLLFWGSFEQAGSSLNLFADVNTDRNILKWVFPAGWFQFVQPIFVVVLAPVFAWIWLRLSRRDADPSSPAKFSMALLFAGLGFAVLIPAARLIAASATPEAVKVSMWWLILTYFLQTLGELCLSPVGLSAMSKLAPDRAAGFIMGIWFLSTAIGNWLAGKAASMYDALPLPRLFGFVAWPTIAAAVILALLIRPTVRLMSGVR